MESWMSVGRSSRGAARWDAFEHKEWDKRCMEVYAAMVDRMDQGIGRIIDVLEKKWRIGQHARGLFARQRRLR